MPTYEYKCSACGHELEAFQKMTDAPITLCPNCGAEDLQKLVSAAGFQLKGTGWYVTDFRDKGKKPADPNKSDAAPETKSTAEAPSPDPTKKADSQKAAPVTTSPTDTKEK